MRGGGEVSDEQRAGAALIRFAPGVAAALAALALVLAAALLSPPVVGVATRAAEVYWRLTPEGLARAPSFNEAPADLRRPPFGESDPVQFTHRFSLSPGDPPVSSVQAQVLDVEPQFTVNNVPTARSARMAATGSYLTRPGARFRCWDIESAHQHTGENRIDLVVETPALSGLGSPLRLAFGEDCSTVIKGVDAVLPPIRSLVPILAAIAVVCALAAALTTGVWPTFIGVAAVAATLGVRAWLGILAPEVSLGHRWLSVDLLLLTAAAIGAGLALWSLLQGRIWRLMLALLGLAAAGGAGLAVVLAGSDHGASVTAAAAAVSLSTLFAVGSAIATMRKVLDLGLVKGAAVGAMGGLALSILAAAVWSILAGPALSAGLLPEIVYGLGLCILLAAAVAGSATIAGRATWRLASIWLDQSSVVRSQREALDQQTRKSAVLEERQRLARDMHDGIGGRLASLIAQVRSRRIGIEQLEGELVGGLAELRLLVDSLDAVGESLAVALISFRGRVQPQAEAAGMSLEWNQPEPLPIETRDPRWLLNLYRLLQEAVANAVQHSGGDRLMISVEHPAGRTLHISVEDNGAFRPAGSAGAGKGLSNMAHRAKAMGATFEFGPRLHGPGTRVLVTLEVPEPPGEVG